MFNIMHEISMEWLPKRTSLVTETALTLKKWINSRVLKGRLPGELPLKNRLRVSRDTLRLALKTLEREGWVTPAVQGSQRQVIKPLHPSAKPSSRQLPVSFLSPFPIVDRIILLEMEDLQRHLTEQGRELRFLSPHIFQARNPHRHLARLVEENVSAAWILHAAGYPIQRWFEQQGIPTLIYGTPFPGINLPSVANDWESAAYHAGLHVIRYGHRIIGNITFADETPGALALTRGLRRALATAAPPASLQVYKDHRTPESIADALERVFEGRPRPTVLVFSASNQLLTTLSWMVSRRIGVPEDISLVCIPSDTWLQDLYPPVCHYENNSEMFAHHIRRRVMELMETARVKRESILVTLEYKPGSSLGPPPA